MGPHAVVLGLLIPLLGLAEMAEAADVEGVVRLAGKVAMGQSLRPTADLAVCGSAERPSEALIVSASGGVKNAVVLIAHERMGGWRSRSTFVMDQRRCTFVPRILVIPPGSTVEVLNSDEILHNFHTVARFNPSLNLAQPARARPLRVTFEHPEVVEVKCDVHGTGFMQAWIVVAAHPFYALSDEQGRFLLPGLLPGPHVLEVWHEVLGTKRVPITVGHEGVARVTVEFGGGERK